MAVEYFHRLVLTGRPAVVDRIRRKLRRTVQRTIAGESRRETVPFSFVSLYELAPAAIYVEDTVPCDPFDMSVWPTKRLSSTKAQVRYAMQTRNMGLDDFIYELARTVYGITFHLMTDCEGEIACFEFRKGSYRQCKMSESGRRDFWELARKKFGLIGDAVYDDEEAGWFAQEEMRRAAFNYWDPKKLFRLAAIRSWSGKWLYRDLDSERFYAMAELNSEMDGAEPVQAVHPSRAARRQARSTG